MHAAFSLAKHSVLWVVGCDMPFISCKAAELLWTRKQDGFDAVVPLVAGELYPLHGIYDRECNSRIAALLQQGETNVSALMNHLFWNELPDGYLKENGVEMNFISSIKTIADYEASQ
ncbi:molybdopterin-guanine dinucleotide biosynthesis protein MobA [compost metagenome]